MLHQVKTSVACLLVVAGVFGREVIQERLQNPCDRCFVKTAQYHVQLPNGVLSTLLQVMLLQTKKS